MNLISNLLTKYSLNKLVIITGENLEVLRDLRAGKIPDYISLHNGKYIAASSVLEKQIKNSVSEYMSKLKWEINQNCVKLLV